MGECGNMPDWHPYNQPQSSRGSGAPGSQNASTGHMFITSMSPPALDGMNLSTESRHQPSSKHQTDQTPFAQRNYQAGLAMSSTSCPTSSTLTQGVHMNSLTGCPSHYAPTTSRNPMIDGLTTSMDPRLGSVTGINDEVSHRTGQMSFPIATNHPNPPSMNVNPGNPMHGGAIVPPNCPPGSMSPGRQPPGYGACKAPCCNPDANISYQHWDKFNPYNPPPNPASYRDNIRQTGYSIENRRFIADMNLRKDCLDGKDHDVSGSYPMEHRRNYSDYKYRKDGTVINRNYANNGNNNLIQNYTMQNYNYPNDYQKCPYSMKDYMRRGNSGVSGITPKNSGMIKYQEQQNVLSQQKYQHSKHMQYQNGTVVPSGLQNSTSTSGMPPPSPLQNSYYNTGQMSRDLARDYSRDYQQEQNSLPNRIPQPGSSHVHGSYTKYHQIYHQKIAMQRYSVENHMRAFSRIPGYQSHPKYQECVMRYRELLRLQQTVDYQNVIQDGSKIPSPTNPAATATAPTATATATAATPVAPINLQFDQNGILINSNYITPPGYSPIHGTHNNPSTSTENPHSSANVGTNAATNLENVNQFVDRAESGINLNRHLEHELQQRNPITTMQENAERYFMNGEKNINPGRYENENTSNVVKTKITDNGHLENNSTNTENVDYKNSKDFADKPELDVRQFLANWDESEDEDAASAATAPPTCMPDVTSTGSNEERFVGTQLSEKTVKNNCQQKHSTERTTNDEKKEDNSVSVEVQSLVNSTETTASVSSSKNNKNSGETILREKIHCVRTDDGVDDIPTIHIVESLEEGSEMEKIQTVFGSLTSAVLNPITMGDTSVREVVEGKTIVLFEQTNGVCSKTLEFTVPTNADGSQVVEGVIASIIDSTISKPSDSDCTKKNDSKNVKNLKNLKNLKNVESEGGVDDEIVKSTSPSSQSIYTTRNSVSTGSCSSKTNSEESTNLTKQNSFTNDESHNPDDISLPDLQTSECTPMSTTLNTPIHSDSEESSEHVTDLTTSTNPIEIIPNSPIISFTHSPIKIEPYEQLNERRINRRDGRRHGHDSLDFDFEGEVACRENENYNEATEVDEASVVEGLESEQHENSILLKVIPETTKIYNDNNCLENDKNNEFYRSADPLVGTTDISECKNDKINDLRAPEMSGDDAVVKNINSKEPEAVDNCSTILARDDDDYDRSDDLEKLCEITLGDSCIIPLIPGEEEECDEPRMPVSPMEGNCLTNILNDTMPITDLNVLGSSDEDKIDKTDDDMWMEVHYMDKHLNENYDDKVKNESHKMRKIGKIGKIEKFQQEKMSSMKSRKHSDQIDEPTLEISYKSHLDAEMELEDRLVHDEGEKNFHNEINNSIFTVEPLKTTEKGQKDECSEESIKSQDISQRRRNSKDEKPSENEITSRLAVKNTTTKSFSTKHGDSNVEIQVANLNVKINENEKLGKDCAIGKTKIKDSTCDNVEAIEIKINLSRGDIVSHRISNKFIDDDRRKNSKNFEISDNNSHAQNMVKCDFGKKCCRRRRKSMPDGLEITKKSRKNDEPRSPIVQHNSAKKIKKRRKFRKSMDDELLIIQERSRKDYCIEERNYHLEMAKTFDLPWNRDNETENEQSTSFAIVRKEETKRDKKTNSTSKMSNNFRNGEHSKDSRIIFSPCYNSSLDNSSNFNFDNFDVAPHNSSDTETEHGETSKDLRYRKSKSRLDARERHKNFKDYSECRDDSANSDGFEINLNTVPIYTTKDGKINYSPNRNYTYRALIVEARKREDTIRKPFRHSKQSSRSYHFRDNEKCKIGKKRNDEKTDKPRGGGSDGHSIKSKRESSTKHRNEETESKSSRTKKYDDKRKDGNISTELTCRNDEKNKLYSAESISTNRRSFDTISVSPRSESLNNDTEIELTSRKIDVPRINENFNISEENSTTNCNNACAIKNVIDVPKNSEKFIDASSDTNVCKIFQTQQLEISAGRVVANSDERLNKISCHNKSKDSRFFTNTQRGMKIPMASPVVNLEKRGTGWDIDQDCQTVLSDSGLESSTTYTEATKQTRKIQRWKNSFVNRVNIDREIYSNAEDVGYEPMDLSQEKTSRYFDPQPVNPINRPSDNENLTKKIVENDNPMEINSKDKCCAFANEKMEDLNPEKEKVSLMLSKSFTEPVNPTESIRMREIVNSLDLAVANRHPHGFKLTRTINELEKPSKIPDHCPSQIFHRDKEVKNLMKKVSEALIRRASSDDVDDKRSRNSFFSNSSTFLENPETNITKSIIDVSLSLVRHDEDGKIMETKNDYTPITENDEMTDVFNKNSLMKENFDSCKDFLIDTSTSFPSCLKFTVPEPVSEIASECEISRLDDTSTRFASESMDFKEISIVDDSSRNFDFSERRNDDFIGLEDANVGHSLFSSMTENAMAATDEFTKNNNFERFSESPTINSGRLSDSTDKAPILSFSGQINDSRDDECSTKSPPCLVDENSISKIVVKENVYRECSPKRDSETFRKFGNENSTKIFDLEREDISLQPKIPKMIIRNVKSRPGTPTTVDEENPEAGTSAREQKVFQVKIKSSKNNEKREDNKIPKMKIKLEDKQIPRISSDNCNIPEKVVENPKVKMKKWRKSSTSRSPLRNEKFSLVGKLSRQSSETDMRLDPPENMENSNTSNSYKFTLMDKSESKMFNQWNDVETTVKNDGKHVRIPKLTIKKEELTVSGTTSGCSTKKRRPRSPVDSNSKKRKTTNKHSTNKKDEKLSQDVKSNVPENEVNTDSQNLPEIVPKVIIKRTSPSAEFKCELSKVGREAITKDSKWQPEVKLERCWVLDCMAKEPGNPKFALTMLENSLETNDSTKIPINNREWKRSVSDCDLEKLQTHRRRLEIEKKRRKSLDGFSRNDDRRISVETKKIVRPGKNETAERSSKSENRISGKEDIVKNSKTQYEKECRSEIIVTSNVEKNNKIEETLEKCKNDSSSPKMDKRIDSYEDTESTVIKLDSSDESQTTIEILAASPDVSQPEIDGASEIVESMDCGTMGKLYSDDAIPTQFELELEIVDNSTVDSLDVPIPGEVGLDDESTSTIENLHRLERFKPYRSNDDDNDNSQKIFYSDESFSAGQKNTEKSSSNSKREEKLICSSDLLVKEVLAAKETLKRCLTKANDVSKTKMKPRPKTAAEKKQGLGFHFDDLPKISEKPKSEVETRIAVFHVDGKGCGNVGINVNKDKNLITKISNEKTLRDMTEKREKSRKSWSNEKSSKKDCATSSRSDKNLKRSGSSSTNVGTTKPNGKSMENPIRGENSKTKDNIIVLNEGTESLKKDSKNRHRNGQKTSDGKNISHQRGNVSKTSIKPEESSSKMKFYKIPKISKSRDRKADEGRENTSKEDKRKTPSPTIMPVLEPQVRLDFELTGSDRDTSRSPPVITKHEENNVPNELPKKIEDNVNSDKQRSFSDSIEKQDPEAVTFADIVSQLAYHEKATIRHRRYCTLCERWFPTAARHRRHLTGYQHRHTELTQRRTVHALFMLFTGKPCPRLLPASIVRTDCLPGEPTPLQIAVQDVAISLEDGVEAKPKDVSKTND